MLTKITKGYCPNVNEIVNLLKLIHNNLGEFHSIPSLGGKKSYFAH